MKQVECKVRIQMRRGIEKVHAKAVREGRGVWRKRCEVRLESIPVLRLTLIAL